MKMLLVVLIPGMTAMDARRIRAPAFFCFEMRARAFRYLATAWGFNPIKDFFLIVTCRLIIVIVVMMMVMMWSRAGKRT